MFQLPILAAVRMFSTPRGSLELSMHVRMFCLFSSILSSSVTVKLKTWSYGVCLRKKARETELGPKVAFRTLDSV